MLNIAREFARYIIEGNLEMACDMMSDCPEEYKDFKSVKQCLTGINTDNEELTAEYLEEFREKVWEYIRKSKVTINSASFNENGFNNVDYKIELE